MVSTGLRGWGFEFRQTMVHHIAQAVKPGEKSTAARLARFGKPGNAVVDAGTRPFPHGRSRLCDMGRVGWRGD